MRRVARFAARLQVWAAALSGIIREGGMRASAERVDERMLAHLPAFIATAPVRVRVRVVPTLMESLLTPWLPSEPAMEWRKGRFQQMRNDASPAGRGFAALRVRD